MPKYDKDNNDFPSVPSNDVSGSLLEAGLIGSSLAAGGYYSYRSWRQAQTNIKDLPVINKGFGSVERVNQTFAHHHNLHRTKPQVWRDHINSLEVLKGKNRVGDDVIQDIWQRAVRKKIPEGRLGLPSVLQDIPSSQLLSALSEQAVSFR